jgi:hypothetical protein
MRKLALGLFSALLAVGASTAPASAAPVTPKLFIEVGCGRGFWSTAPRTIPLSCATGGANIRNITWSIWTSTGAMGHGTFGFFSAAHPNGDPAKEPVEVFLFTPVTNGGIRYFRWTAMLDASAPWKSPLIGPVSPPKTWVPIPVPAWER